MGSARDAAVKGYIHLPLGIRRFLDPHVKNRGKYGETVNKYFNAEKGKKALKDGVRSLFAGKRRRRK